MKTMRSPAALVAVSVPRTTLIVFLVLACCPWPLWADGCFVSKWQKEDDIFHPAQKAIILFDGGEEDLILQVKYEGPVEQFGWLVPVPGKPEVTKASMESFYELSKWTQLRRGHGKSGRATPYEPDDTQAVTVHERKTVGAYEIAVLSATKAGALEGWLKESGFSFPAKNQDVLTHYVSKKWHFVAIKVNLANEAGVEVERELRKGELHPLKMTFKTEECVFPLKISSVNPGHSLVHIYMISREPALCGKLDFVTQNVDPSTESLLCAPMAFPNDSALKKDLPRLRDAKWYVMKHVGGFMPGRMEDLSFSVMSGKDFDKKMTDAFMEWVTFQDRVANSDGKRVRPESWYEQISLKGPEYYLAFGSVYAPDYFEKVGRTANAYSFGIVPWERVKGHHEEIARHLARIVVEHPDAEDRFVSLGVLVAMGEKALPGVKILAEELLDPERIENRYKLRPWRSKELAVFGSLLARVHDKRALESMIALTRCPLLLQLDPDPEKRTVVLECLITGLGATKSSEAVPSIAAHLAKNGTLNKTAMDALVAIGGKTAAEAIASFIRRERRYESCETHFGYLWRMDREIAWQCALKGIDGDRDASAALALGMVMPHERDLTTGQWQQLFERALKLPKSGYADTVLSRYAEDLASQARTQKEPDWDGITGALLDIREKIHESRRSAVDGHIVNVAAEKHRRKTGKSDSRTEPQRGRE